MQNKLGLRSKYNLTIANVWDIVNSSVINRMDINRDWVKCRDYPAHSEFYSVGDNFKIEIRNQAHPCIHSVMVLKNKTCNTVLAEIYNAEWVANLAKALRLRAGETPTAQAAAVADRAKVLMQTQKVARLAHIH